MIADPSTVSAPVSAAEFKSAMRRLAGGVSVIASEGSDGPLGLTATSVVSLTAEPASLLCCINRSVAAVAAIRERGQFAVSLLRTEHEEIARRFAGMTGHRGSDRFDPTHWTTLDNGAPALSGALASFGCELVHCLEMSTHSVLVGRITSVSLGGLGAPLVYWDGQFMQASAS